MSFEVKLLEMHASGKVSLTQAAKNLGICRFKLRSILDSMNLVWPQAPRSGKHTINGITDTLENHAKRHKTTVASLRWSLSRGLPIRAPSFNPIEEEEMLAFLLLQESGMTVKKSAETVGRPRASIQRAIKQTFPEGLSGISKKRLEKIAANEGIELPEIHSA